jgi:hypothetical protein
MEKVLDLKVPGVTELGRKELKEVNGGTPQLALLGIKIVIAIDSFMDGFVDGFKENKT